MSAEVVDLSSRGAKVLDREAELTRTDISIREYLRSLLESEDRIAGMVVSIQHLNGPTEARAHVREAGELLTMQKVLNQVIDQTFWEMA